MRFIFSVAAKGLFVVFIGLYGVLCIVRPKFGNLSRSMGLIFVSVAASYAALQLASWRAVAISFGVFVTAGLFWCGIECFRLRKARVLSKAVGVSVALLGVGSEYFAWLIWFHIPTR